MTHSKDSALEIPINVRGRITGCMPDLINKHSPLLKTGGHVHWLCLRNKKALVSSTLEADGSWEGMT